MGFGGAIKDRRIIVFVKKQRNKDQVTEAELLSGMTIGRAEKRNGEMGVFISMYESVGGVLQCMYVQTYMCTHVFHPCRCRTPCTVSLDGAFHPWLNGGCNWSLMELTHWVVTV